MTGIHFLDAKGPEGIRIFAIGDVHGRLDLLQKMHETIHADLAANPPSDWRIVHLGDYVDRGSDSAGVLEFLSTGAASDESFICLAGNHDAGFAEFLDHPEAEGLFARYGGADTARSYGVEINFNEPGAFRQGHVALVRAVPESHRTFLKTLRRSFSMGDFFFCHAGVRPGVPLDGQDGEDLIWIRNEFLNYPGLFEKIVVHGHTPGPEAEIMANRVNLDTKAFQSGVLTALRIDGQDKRIVSVSA